MVEHPTIRWQSITKYRNWLGLLAAVLCLVLSWILTYFLLKSGLEQNIKNASLAVIATLVNLASTAAVFVVASVLFQREDDAKLEDTFRHIILETQERPVDLSQVRFEDLIDRAEEIDFVVQGWNGWAAQRPTARALTNFFERGGRFRLYLCHPDSPQAVPNRGAMERRLGRNPGQIAEEIRGTVQTIDDIFQSIKSKYPNRGKLDIYLSNELNWYFAAYFRAAKSVNQVRGLNMLVLSVYSHTPGTPPWQMPAFQVYLDQHPRMQEWFETEMKHLRDGVPRDTVQQPGSVQ
jgi:hypothetical protein